MCHVLYSTSETAHEVLNRALSLHKPYVTRQAKNIRDVESLHDGNRESTVSNLLPETEQLYSYTEAVSVNFIKIITPATNYLIHNPENVFMLGFWVIKSCRRVGRYKSFRGTYCFHFPPEEGGSIYLRNVSIYLKVHTILRPRRQTVTSSSP